MAGYEVISEPGGSGMVKRAELFSTAAGQFHSANAATANDTTAITAGAHASGRCF